MEKIVFTGKSGPCLTAYGSNFKFEFDHIFNSIIIKKNVEVAISRNLIALNNVDAEDVDIFFNCLIKELYRNGLKNISGPEPRINISTKENVDLYKSIKRIRFVKNYEINI